MSTVNNTVYDELYRLSPSYRCTEVAKRSVYRYYISSKQSNLKSEPKGSLFTIDPGKLYGESSNGEKKQIANSDIYFKYTKHKNFIDDKNITSELYGTYYTTTKICGLPTSILKVGDSDIYGPLSTYSINNTYLKNADDDKKIQLTTISPTLYSYTFSINEIFEIIGTRILVYKIDDGCYKKIKDSDIKISFESSRFFNIEFDGYDGSNYCIEINKLINSYSTESTDSDSSNVPQILFNSTSNGISMAFSDTKETYIFKDTCEFTNNVDEKNWKNHASYVMPCQITLFQNTNKGIILSNYSEINDSDKTFDFGIIYSDIKICQNKNVTIYDEIKKYNVEYTDSISIYNQYPFYMKDDLASQCTTGINTYNALPPDTDSIVRKIDSNHTSIMFFHKGKLMTPSTFNNANNKLNITYILSEDDKNNNNLKYPIETVVLDDTYFSAEVCYKLIPDKNNDNETNDNETGEKGNQYVYYLPVNKHINPNNIEIVLIHPLSEDESGDFIQDELTKHYFKLDSNGLYKKEIREGKNYFTFITETDGSDIEKYSKVYYQQSIMLNSILSEIIESPKPDDYNKTIDLSKKLEYNEFNKVIKITIKDGEIIDCGYADTDEVTNEFIFDAKSEQVIDLKSVTFSLGDCKPHVYAIDVGNGYSNYFNLEEKSDDYLAYPIPHQLSCSDSKLLAFVGGKLTDEFVINKNIYYNLFGGESMLSFTDDFSELGNSKPIYLVNLPNYSLYQDESTISIESGIFTLGEYISDRVLSQRRVYNDIYMLPFSKKYMILFINGYYIPQDCIIEISNRRFALSTNISKYVPELLIEGKLKINKLLIYSYNVNTSKYHNISDYYNPEKAKKIDELHELHPLNDCLWDIINKNYENNNILENISIEPYDSGYNPGSTSFGLWEIFGKYVLNKYDIDNDSEVAAEIRSYFKSLYDKDGRLPLNNPQNSDKRKFEY